MPKYVKIGPNQYVPQKWHDLQEETYLIARKFHWGYEEIMRLPNWERKMWANMIREEIKAEQKEIEEQKRKMDSSKVRRAK